MDSSLIRETKFFEIQTTDIRIPPKKASLVCEAGCDITIEHVRGLRFQFQSHIYQHNTLIWLEKPKREKHSILTYMYMM